MKKEVEFRDNIYIVSALVFMLLIYAPLELLFNNKAEFWFDMYMLLPIMVIVSLFVLLCGTLILKLLFIKNKKMFYIGTVFLIYVFIGTYIQGNFLVNNLPPLDGTWIDWSLYPVERIKSILLWGILLVLILLLCKRVSVKTFIIGGKYLCLGMACMLFITLICLGVTTKGYERKANLAISDKFQFQMSTDQNMIIFLLDAVSGDAWREVYEKHPEYKEIFEDFTFFEDTVGAYSYTKHAIPFVLSGEWFENEEEFETYEQRVYLDNPLFDTLEENGYRLGMYEEFMPFSGEEYMRFENIIPNQKGCTDYWAFVRWNIQMVGLRYAPYDLKRICFVNPDAFNTLKVNPKDANIFSWKNDYYYKALQNTPITYTDDKCFKFTHIYGAHLPHQYDINVNIIPYEEGSYEQNIEASMTITAAYLEKLREASVYDNSVIIILADHGWVADSGLYRQNPILFIKGINEKHTFTISEKPVSYEGLQSAYLNLMNGMLGDEAMPESDAKNRRYIYYDYLEDGYMWEYVQHGKAYDRSTFEQTGETYVAK